MWTTSCKILKICGHVEEPGVVIVRGVVHVRVGMPILIMNACIRIL